MILHKHNLETYENIKKLFCEHNRVVAVQPTGTGKSFLILQLIADNHDKSFLIVSPSMYIYIQLQIHADKYSINMENCNFVTFSKLSKMTESELLELDADYIVLDEFHRCGAVEWSRGVENILSVKPDAKVFGTSATPIRYLDSFRNMAEELFDGNYAVNMTLAEAIRRKILPLPIYVTSLYSFSCDIARLEKRAETSRNPYFRIVLLGKIQKAKSMITELNCGLESIFSRHMTNKSGKYIVFCPNVERLKQVYDESNHLFSNINPNIHKYAVYSQNTASEKEYKKFCDDNNENALKFLFSVNMLNEGVHIEGIDGVIMLRATKSANVFYQQLGRALSCASGKKPVIFDIVNNYESGDTAKQYAEIMQIGRQYGKGEEYDIQFELYDYVQDIRDILDELHNTFNDSWDIVFELLLNFIKEKKRFPEHYEEYRDYKLGIWCSNQRVFYNAGTLSQERIDLLNSINFIWDAKDERWMSSFRLAKNFFDKNNRLPIRSDTMSNEEIEYIYHWLSQQKTKMKEGSLSEQRTELLESIGCEKQKTLDDVWEENFSEFKSYLKENGKCPATTEARKDEKTNSIYRWMLYQRKAYKLGKLTSHRIEKLEAIDFIWDAKLDLWNRQFALLQKFILKNHRLPNVKDKIDDAGIGQWYLKQKKYIESGKLSPELAEKIQSLDEIEMSYMDVDWQKNYNAVKRFMENIRRLPYTDEIFDGINLYQWIIQQKVRYSEGKLKQKYIDKFTEIGIDIKNFSSAKEVPIYA